MLNLIKKIKSKSVLQIKGNIYHPKAKVLYKEKTGDNISDYFKVFMKEQHAILVYLIESDKLFFGFDKGNIGDDFLNKIEFLYGGQKFKVVSKGYQYVCKFLFGSPFDVEGECSFRDCETLTGDKKTFVNLGVLSKNNKRADIVGFEIEENDLKIL